MGPRPKGDPGAIRETAEALNDAAGQLEGRIGVASLNLAPEAFVGPARAGIDAGISDLTQAARAAALVLRIEAASLITEADTLETEQKVWDRLDKEAREERAADERMCKIGAKP